MFFIIEKYSWNKNINSVYIHNMNDEKWKNYFDIEENTGFNDKEIIFN